VTPRTEFAGIDDACDETPVIPAIRALLARLSILREQLAHNSIIKASYRIQKES